MASSAKHIQVAVGVITKNNSFFVCRRQAHQHQGHKWEFPGGKIDLNESAEQALCRELAEEIGIEVKAYQHLVNIAFSYPDKKVSLHVFVVSDFSGEAYGAEGQESKWVCFEELIALDFPDANQIIIEKLLENRR
ncbi:MAG: 8-oxo-dGTP diphosphatase [Kangiellaceae bacterium]|jgi:8-oxo-dGTP diphosphatase